MVVTTIIACAGVIALMVVSYEHRLVKTRNKNASLVKAHNELIEKHNALVNSTTKMVFDYNVLVSILEEDKTIEEIEILYALHRNIMKEKNGGSDKYEGTFYSKKFADGEYKGE